ncbi:hypothetical protein OLMES_4010 [Oleiphilus messinensis]|uniref:Uncharacterized protein n=1 Tax=Oleiphilus messinensis TaxID=141451 RepID=A0A1Y0ID15_9GAMM|nr:hypothetical protein [Oleiphilus messinensis]ARU58029.1 hypothetical protein OLMES_4010 [Oleiphilus messinensis]
MNTRNHRQIRAMKRYARALHLQFEEAAMRWCEIGLAARWAEQN